MENSAGLRRVTMLYGAAMLISLIGLGDAILLTVHHLTGRSVRCAISTGCDAVLASPYATIGGVPIAALGALAYFAAFSLATLAIYGYESTRLWMAILVSLMLISTLWLLYVQAFVLRAFCDYCLLSAAMTLALTMIVILGKKEERIRNKQK
jgi:uncharacterized membrane protein